MALLTLPAACQTVCAVQRGAAGTATSRRSSLRRSQFLVGLGVQRRVVAATILKTGQSASARVTAWFRFGKNGLDAGSAGIYGSQGRDDFDRDDVEHYFNYMGMLAVEGTYDKMEALLNTGIHPVDILLLMAATEGDKPKIQELLRAGARCDVKDQDGRTALDRAQDESIRELILEGAKSTSNA